MKKFFTVAIAVEGVLGLGFYVTSLQNNNSMVLWAGVILMVDALATRCVGEFKRLL